MALSSRRRGLRLFQFARDCGNVRVLPLQIAAPMPKRPPAQNVEVGENVIAPSGGDFDARAIRRKPIKRRAARVESVVCQARDFVMSRRCAQPFQFAPEKRRQQTVRREFHDSFIDMRGQVGLARYDFAVEPIVFGFAPARGVFEVSQRIGDFVSPSEKKMKAPQRIFGDIEHVRREQTKRREAAFEFVALQRAQNRLQPQIFVRGRRVAESRRQRGNVKRGRKRQSGRRRRFFLDFSSHSRCLALYSACSYSACSKKLGETASDLWYK